MLVSVYCTTSDNFILTWKPLMADQIPTVNQIPFPDIKSPSQT